MEEDVPYFIFVLLPPYISQGSSYTAVLFGYHRTLYLHATGYQINHHQRHYQSHSANSRSETVASISHTSTCLLFKQATTTTSSPGQQLRIALAQDNVQHPYEATLSEKDVLQPAASTVSPRIVCFLLHPLRLKAASLEVNTSLTVCLTACLFLQRTDVLDCLTHLRKCCSCASSSLPRLQSLYSLHCYAHLHLSSMLVLALHQIDSTDYTSLSSPLRRHPSTASSSDGSGGSASSSLLASSYLSGSSAPTSVGHTDILHESPEALHPKYHHGAPFPAINTEYNSGGHPPATAGGRLLGSSQNGIGRPTPRRQTSYVDLLGAQQLPPPGLADAFAPLQLDSATAQELDEEPPLTLPQPWAVERQRSNSMYGLLRRPSLSTGLNRSHSLLASSAGASTAVNADRLSSSLDLSRSRSRSPLPRPTLNASTSSSIHLQSSIPPDMPKNKFVEGLVGAACIAVEVVWKVPDSQGGFIAPQLGASSSQASVLPLRHFIKEVLRRSRSTCSTLQTALYYIHKSRDVIRERVRAAEEAKIQLMRIKSSGQVDAASWNGFTLPSPPYGDHDQYMSQGHLSPSPQNIAALLAKVRDPVLCGRRMFLAALICASKFLQDRTYSNRAWAKISSLPCQEINTNEKAFLQVLDYNLCVNADLFRNWTRRLQDLADKQSRKQPLLSSGSTLSSTPLGSVSLQQKALLGSHLAAAQRENLERASSEYLPAPASLETRVKPSLSSMHTTSASILPRPSLSQAGRFATSASSFPTLQSDSSARNPFGSSLVGSCSGFARHLGGDWSSSDNMVA